MLLVALLVGLCMPVMAQTFDSSKEYYLRNVQTGMFMKIGGNWGETAALDVAAHPFKFVKNTDNVTYAIQHQAVWISSDGLGQTDDAFYSKWRIEAVTGTQDQYYLIGSNMSAITAQASEYSMELLLEPFNAADNRQKWEILTASGFVAQGKISNASASNPINLTHLIKGASFDYAEHGVLKNYWATTVYNHDGSVSTKDAWCHELFAMQVRPGFGGEPDVNPTPDVYNGCFNAANNIWNRFSITQTTEVSLPAGNYVFSFEGFNRRALNDADGWNNTNATPDVTVQLRAGNNNLGSAAILTKITGSKAYGLGLTHSIIAGDVRTRGRITSEIFRDNDEYLHEIKFSIQTPTTITINITKGENVANSSDDGKYDDGYEGTFWDPSTNYQNLIAMDNFTLLYLGEKDTDVNETNSYWERLKAADQNYKAIMDSWKTADDAYEVTSYCSGKYTDKVNSDKLVIGESAPAKINNNNVDTEAEFNTAMTTLRNAYAAALAAHSQHLATRIINPTFNFGTFGWNGVFKVLTENGDNVASSDYSSIKQTIYPTPDEPTMSNGLYKLTAQVTSEAGNTVYLTGNGYQKGYVIATSNTFVDAELYFLVEDGSATIGVVGGSGAGNSLYYPWDGCAFKADDFAMERVCDVEHGKLKLALLDAEDVVNCTDATRYSDAVKQQIKTKLTEKFGQVYETLIATEFKNYTGTATAKDVYVILQEAVKTQVTAGSDMTYALMNHSFQLGSTEGWTVGASSDTGVKENLNATYTTRGVDGRYLFNTHWQGIPLTQKVENLPTGKYKLEVMIASGDKDNDATTYLLADGDGEKIDKQNYQGFNPPSRGKTFTDASFEFDVLNGSATIGVVGGKDDDSESSSLGTYDENGYWWYKADNFRLTLVEPAVLDLYDNKGEEQFQLTRFYDPFIWINVHRTIKADSWSTLVLPFDMPIPEGWVVKKLSTTNKPVHNDGNITLRFDKVDEIKAGIPYMVKLTEECEMITVAGASLNALHNWEEEDSHCSNSTTCGTYKVTFVGSYTPGTLPETVEGKEEIFFVSGNKFYRSTGTGNNMKAFRAYFKIESTSADAPALRSLSMRIGDETIIESVEDEVTVVGIYNANGVKLESMQPGINILRMNNGTTKKVIVK